jgi:hypothetical protein
MVLHILNKKAQINLGFLIAVVLLSILVLVVVLSILRTLPASSYAMEQENLRSNAVGLGTLLVEDPGYPSDLNQWGLAPQRIGFADYNAYSNRTKLGELSLEKINYIETNITYSNAKSGLGLEGYDFRVQIVNNSDSSVLLDFYNSTSPETSNSVAIKRFSIVQSVPVTITLEVWET